MEGGRTPRGLEETVLADPGSFLRKRESNLPTCATTDTVHASVGFSFKNGRLILPRSVRHAAAFLQMIRFYNHQNFSIVIFGALFFSERPHTPTLETPFLGLISLYFSFNVCLYGEGIQPRPNTNLA